ncbi:MAG: DNA polymerase III subunit chi [Betaproteobacteria bacterium]|nr:DNA polymerase III subunit chi [Betaproteobacteria bacterium]MSQ87729.1 DNA polymerase III subunit chi [Betaproteobacteria bacterium]
MTSIDFYFNAGDRLAIACRLAGKALRQKKRVLIYAAQMEVAQKIDRLLWASQAVSFIPHCYTHDPLAAATPILIAVGDTPMASPNAACEVLLNLATVCPPFFERHERLLEVVTQDDEDKLAGRARYAFYRDRGYAIRNHDLSGQEHG